MQSIRHLLEKYPWQMVLIIPIVWNIVLLAITNNLCNGFETYVLGAGLISLYFYVVMHFVFFLIFHIDKFFNKLFKENRTSPDAKNWYFTAALIVVIIIAFSRALFVTGPLCTH